MKRFVTDYRDPETGVAYSYTVDACDFAHAQMLCDERRPGETVAGVLYAMIAADGFSHDRADAMCQMFADSGDDEPPEAEAFDSAMLPA